jgi:hypothetical protein
MDNYPMNSKKKKCEIKILFKSMGEYVYLYAIVEVKVKV